MAYINYISARTQVRDINQLPIAICEIILSYHKEDEKNEQLYLEEACEKGDFEGARFLYNLGAKLSVAARDMMIKSGNMKMIVFFSAFTKLSIVSAAIHGNLEVYDFIYNLTNGTKFNIPALTEQAIMYGNLSIVQHIMSNEITHICDMFEWAIKYDQVHIAEFLLEKDKEEFDQLLTFKQAKDFEIFHMICKKEQLALFKYINKTKIPDNWQKKGLKSALVCEKEGSARFLFSMFKYSSYFLRHVIEVYLTFHDNVRLTKLCVENGADLGSTTLKIAIMYNGVKNVSYMLEQFSYPNYNEFLETACSRYIDRVEIVKLLIKYGAIPNYICIVKAINKGFYGTVREFLRAKNWDLLSLAGITQDPKMLSILYTWLDMS